MDEVGCPRCKTTKYRNPNIKLLVNSCGHALCDNCIELLFAKGSGPCPECGFQLRRAGFRLQLFEDPVVEKDVDIRRRLMKDYCKTEMDFESLRDYNDYLEELETNIFNLVHNIDVLETNKRIDQYKKDNREQIAKARARQNPELLELDAMLEEEKLLAEYRQLESTAMEKEERLRKLKSKEALIDDLMFTDTDAESIIATHKSQNEKQDDHQVLAMDELAKRKREILAETTARLNMIKTHGVDPPSRPQFSTGISTGINTGTFLPVPKKSEEALFKYVEPEISNNGPAIPTLDNLKHIATRKSREHGSIFSSFTRIDKKSKYAGGYHVEYELRRALAAGFGDIYFNSKLEAGVTSFPIPSNEEEGYEEMDLDS